MSLRRDIHAAIDEVAPSVPGLSRQVANFVFEDQATQRALLRIPPSAQWRLLRGTLSMVAAALIVVLMAAVVVGPRLWRDRNASVSHPPTTNQAELKKLEARPLVLPTLPAGAECPEGPFSQPPPEAHLGPVRLYGLGPVYIAEIHGKDAQALQTNWGTYLYVTYTVPPGSSGLVLIRARDLQSNQLAVFVRYLPGEPEATATGEQLGTDVLDERRVLQFSELALDTDRMHSNLPGWWPYQKSTVQGFARGSSLCIGYQVDGPGFTEVFVANYSS